VHPEGAIVEQNKDFDASPDGGTGPCQMASYTAGRTVVLDRFDGYWGTKAQVQRMNIRFLPDPQTPVEALKSGQVDLVVDLPANATSSFAADLDKAPQLLFWPGLSITPMVLAFNLAGDGLRDLLDPRNMESTPGWERRRRRLTVRPPAPGPEREVEVEVELGG